MNNRKYVNNFNSKKLKLRVFKIEKKNRCKTISAISLKNSISKKLIHKNAQRNKNLRPNSANKEKYFKYSRYSKQKRNPLNSMNTIVILS